MNGFFEFMDVSYFSSDLNNSSLIVSEKNGALRYISDTMGSSTPDHFKKHVRFYPVDDFLFTSTDTSLGLRVWDREKETEVYRYPSDALGCHEYSSSSMIGSLSPNGVKFYDLRTKYHTSTCSVSIPLGLVWNKDDLLVFTETSISKYNLRRDGLEIVLKDRGISSVMISGNDLYYLKYSGGRHYLVKHNLDYEIETVGSKGFCGKDGTIFVFGNNEIKFYSKTGSHLVDLKFIKRIEGLMFSGVNTYLFADKKLFIREGGVEGFMEGLV